MQISCSLKVKFSHTRYRALGPELIPVYRQSARRWHTFNGPFSGTTQVSRYQKGKTNLDFTEAKDSEWQRHQLGHMQVCTLLQTDNHASTPPLSFLQAGCPSCRPTNSIKALKAKSRILKQKKTYWKIMPPFRLPELCEFCQTCIHSCHRPIWTPDIEWRRYE